MKLTIQNLGKATFVAKDPQGYSYFKCEVPGLSSADFEVSPDVVYRMGPQLQDAVAHPIPDPNNVGQFLAKIAYNAIVSAQDAFEFVYTMDTRPAANSVPPGTPIFVSDEGANGAPQWSNGTVWVNAEGDLS